MKAILFLNIFIILICAEFSLFARDYKKTEEMINSILAEESDNRSRTEDAGEVKAVQLEEESPDEKRDDQEKNPVMSGKDVLLLKNGIELYNSGMMDSSFSAFNELLNNYPGSIFLDNARIWAGRIHLNKNDYDSAINLFSAVSDSSGEYPASLFYTGEALRNKGDLNRAIEIFKKLFNAYPENEYSDKSLLIVGKIYLRLNKGYQALESAMTIIKHYSSRDSIDDAYYLMAKIYQIDALLKDLESARTIYKKFLHKADSGEKFFKDSPLLPAVKKDLDNLERLYFRLEK